MDALQPTTSAGDEGGDGQPLPRGLPAWVYRDERFYRLEVQRVLLPAWQVVCHVNDIPDPGDYRLLDFLARPIVVIRGESGRVNAFYNVCRHRAARLLDGDAGGGGRCERGRIVCPYHAWSYDLDGRLIAMPRAGAYPGLEREEYGLTGPELEIWQGFVFVRCLPGGPSVAEMMAPWAETLDRYRLPELGALGRVTLRPRAVNWKTVIENYADGLHIAVAHRGLAGLAGDSYRLEAGTHVMHMSADVDARAAAGASGRAYCEVLPEQPHLPAALQRRWNYYLLWPNLAFDVYPEQIDFMQMIPLGPGRTLIREIPYGLPDGRRETRAARYLNWRVNRVVNAEDRDLIERVQSGMDSGVFEPGPLSEDEVCLRALADRLRQTIPEACHPRPPWGDPSAESAG
jgi:phenylpropionate dioxygenase-like ring-hydroxylating dioxygenase large terminal subunit